MRGNSLWRDTPCETARLTAARVHAFFQKWCFTRRHVARLGKDRSSSRTDPVPFSGRASAGRHPPGAAPQRPERPLGRHEFGRRAGGLARSGGRGSGAAGPTDDHRGDHATRGTHLVVGIRKGVWRAAPRPLTRLAATGQTFDLLSTEAGLLVASGEGVALVRGGMTRVLTETPAYGSTGAPKIRRPSTSLATRRVFSVSSGGTLSGGFRTRRIESTPPSTRWPRIREEPSDWAPGTAVSFGSTWRMPT